MEETAADCIRGAEDSARSDCDAPGRYGTKREDNI